MEFAAQGAAVCIADVDVAKADSMVQKLVSTGARAIAVTADVTSFDQAKAAASATLEQFGSVDILVNCAGWNQFRAVEDYTPEYWQQIRAVNLDGQWNFCTAV